MFCSKLPRYVRMVDQILLSTLVRLSRSSIVDFVNLTMMPDPAASREALFKTALVFNHKTGTQCKDIVLPFCHLLKNNAYPKFVT